MGILAKVTKLALAKQVWDAYRNRRRRTKSEV